jgi:hypothetical protein
MYRCSYVYQLLILNAGVQYTEKSQTWRNNLHLQADQMRGMLESRFDLIYLDNVFTNIRSGFFSADRQQCTASADANPGIRSTNAVLPTNRIPTAPETSAIQSTWPTAPYLQRPSTTAVAHVQQPLSHSQSQQQPRTPVLSEPYATLRGLRSAPAKSSVRTPNRNAAPATPGTFAAFTSQAQVRTAFHVLVRALYPMVTILECL